MSADGRPSQGRSDDTIGAASTQGIVKPADKSDDVVVETFLGDVAISLQDINKLKKGDVLPLGASLADPVELRVDGQRVARGELVAVGDRFGVRISEIK